MKKVVAVTSGGMDSISMGLKMLKDGYDVLYVHFNYGQRSEKKEEEACQNVVNYLKRKGWKVSLQLVDVPFFKDFSGSSSLVNKNEKVPLGMESLRMSSEEIGNLWVPSRNVIFLAIASGYAEAMKADYITWGANQSEVGYKDNTMEFANRFSYMLEYGCLNHIPKVTAPLYDLDKPHILKWDIDNGFYPVLSYTWSCDNGEKFMCGECGCCMNRRFAFYVLEKKYGKDYKDNGTYVNKNYFKKVYLKELKEKCTKKMWMYKYLGLLE